MQWQLCQFRHFTILVNILPLRITLDNEVGVVILSLHWSANTTKSGTWHYSWHFMMWGHNSIGMCVYGLWRKEDIFWRPSHTKCTYEYTQLQSAELNCSSVKVSIVCATSNISNRGLRWINLFPIPFTYRDCAWNFLPSIHIHYHWTNSFLHHWSHYNPCTSQCRKPHCEFCTFTVTFLGPTKLRSVFLWNLIWLLLFPPCRNF